MATKVEVFGEWWVDLRHLRAVQKVIDWHLLYCTVVFFGVEIGKGRNKFNHSKHIKLEPCTFKGQNWAEVNDNQNWNSEHKYSLFFLFVTPLRVIVIHVIWSAVACCQWTYWVVYAEELSFYLLWLVGVKASIAKELVAYVMTKRIWNRWGSVSD